jgi:hypothetical protein
MAPPENRVEAIKQFLFHGQATPGFNDLRQFPASSLHHYGAGILFDAP